MKKVLVPTTDVNSEQGIIVSWKITDRDRVDVDDPIAEIETSKAVIEAVSPARGHILHLFPEGTDVNLDEPIALIFDREKDLSEYAARLSAEAERVSAEGDTLRATAKARKLADDLGVDLGSLGVDGLITVKHVEAAARQSRTDLPMPLVPDSDEERVLLIGAGLGATQVIDIFRGGTGQVAVAILDDDPAKWGLEICGVPVCGGTEHLQDLLDSSAFDTAVIAVGTSVKGRAKIREVCAKAGVVLTNAIDPTAKVASDVEMGKGNVICAFCHFGTGTVVGDNNFFSAYNSYDHHNVLGSDNATGPGVVTSGLVQIGDRCRLGTGIFIEPYVRLNSDVRVASGAIILKDVPAEHTVKTKTVTTVVVPNRR